MLLHDLTSFSEVAAGEMWSTCLNKFYWGPTQGARYVSQIKTANLSSPKVRGNISSCPYVEFSTDLPESGCRTKRPYEETTPDFNSAEAPGANGAGNPRVKRPKISHETVSRVWKYREAHKWVWFLLNTTTLSAFGTLGASCIEWTGQYDAFRC
jgi:hypothetical protein